MKSRFFLITLIVVALDIFLWLILARSFFAADNLTLSFLDVGQGDSQLIELPEGPKVLIDSGPDSRVLDELEVSLGVSRYIDLVIITHPEADHANGYIHILRRYRVGAIAVTGRDKDTESWHELTKMIGDLRIPVVRLGEGDSIRVGNSVFDILAPNAGFRESAALNDTALVIMLKSGGVKTLLTADIGENVERALVGEYDIDADILKVGHHGSRFSSSQDFLAEVTPAVAVIQVGKGNRYGHPAQEVLERLGATGAKIYRNDTDGRIVITVKDGVARVKKE